MGQRIIKPSKVELYLRKKKVLELYVKGTTLSDIRNDKEYRDYIGACQQYIDCEENVNTAVLPHNLTISVKSEDEIGFYETTVEAENAVLTAMDKILADASMFD